MKVVLCLLCMTIWTAPAQASCLIIGDSIGQDLHTFLPECRSSALKNRSSAATIAYVRPVDFLIVSAGSNDWESPRVASNLRVIRAKASGKVIWIAPAARCCNPARRAMREVAGIHDDPVLSFVPGDRAGAHPSTSGYRSLARALRAIMAGGS